MRERPEHFPALPAALGMALMAGIAVDWSPRTWRVAVAITSLSVVAALWAVTARKIRLRPQTIPVVLIGAWGFVQLFFAASTVPHSTLYSSTIWAVCGVAFLLGSQILQSRPSRHAFLDLVLWVSTALAILAMLQLYTSPGHVLWLFPADASVMGTFYSKNQFAAFMEIAAPIALWQILRERVALGGACYAVIFAATLTSASRAGLILVSSELILFLTIMVVRRRMPVKSAASLFAILALLVTSASIVAGTQQTMTRFQDPRQYGEARRQLSNSTLKMIAERPWTGSGLGTWRAMYPRFATFDMAVLANEAHNDWAQWAAEGGVPFALLFAVLAIWLGKASVQSIWGLGVPIILAHSYIDYPLREPALAFLWFAMAGALTHGNSAPERTSID